MPGPTSPAGEGGSALPVSASCVQLPSESPWITEVCIFVNNSNTNLIVVDLCTDKVYGKDSQIPAEAWRKGLSSQNLTPVELADFDRKPQECTVSQGIGREEVRGLSRELSRALGSVWVTAAMCSARWQ